jgi:hypothetical protein
VPNWNPNFKGNVILGVDEFKKTGRYFDPNAFVMPAAGTFGNAGRSSIRGPALFNVSTLPYAMSSLHSLNQRPKGLIDLGNILGKFGAR